METITRYTQKICNQLQQCNLRIESRKEIICFFQKGYLGGKYTSI